MAGVEVLVVQGAPVTDAVLEASSDCNSSAAPAVARSTSTSSADSARGLPLVNTPGKNAEAVADQTLAFLVMLARGFPRRSASSRRDTSCGTTGRAPSSWAATCVGTCSGLVGYGHIGQPRRAQTGRWPSG